MTTKDIVEPQNVEFRIVPDTLNRRKFQLRADWQENGKYELMIPANAFRNVAQEQNDTIKASYTASDPTKYAIVKVRVKGTTDDGKYIMQLTNAQGKTQKELRNVTPGEYIFEYVSPGDGMLRVINDKNGNGKWDGGDMVAMRQPERSEIYKNGDGEEVFTTKANWEFEIDVDMDQLFAPITMQSIIDMLNDREDARLKKLAEDMAKKRQEEQKKGHDHGQQNSGMGFGGFGGMGGTGGMGGMGGMRNNNTTGMGAMSSSTSSGTLRR